MRVFEEPAYGENLPRGYTPPQHVAADPRAGTAQPSAPTFTLPGQAEAEQLVRALDGALDGVTSALDEKLGFVTGGGGGAAAAAAAAAKVGAGTMGPRDAAARPRAQTKGPAAARGVVPASGPAGGARTPLGPMVASAPGAGRGNHRQFDLRAELTQERHDLEADVAHLRHRCASLEKENTFLRTRATAAEEQDPLVDQLMAQVGLLVAEKGRLAADNARLGAENRGLQELLAYTSALVQGAEEPRAGGSEGGEEAEAPSPHTPPECTWRAPVEGFRGDGGGSGAAAGGGALFPSGRSVGAGETPLQCASGGRGTPLTPEGGGGGGGGGDGDVVAVAADGPSDGLADVSHVSESWSELGKDSEDEGDEWDGRAARASRKDPHCPGTPAPEGSDGEDEAWIADEAASGQNAV